MLRMFCTISLIDVVPSEAVNRMTCFQTKKTLEIIIGQFLWFADEETEAESGSKLGRAKSLVPQLAACCWHCIPVINLQ